MGIAYFALRVTVHSTKTADDGAVAAVGFSPTAIVACVVMAGVLTFAVAQWLRRRNNTRACSVEQISTGDASHISGGGAKSVEHVSSLRHSSYNTSKRRSNSSSSNLSSKFSNNENHLRSEPSQWSEVRKFG